MKLLHMAATTKILRQETGRAGERGAEKAEREERRTVEFGTFLGFKRQQNKVDVHGSS